jgi:hypothetical protein
MIESKLPMALELVNASIVTRLTMPSELNYQTSTQGFEEQTAMDRHQIIAPTSL